MKSLLWGAALVVTACSHSNSVSSSSPAPAHDPDVITADELTKTTGGTLYDAVRQLRPAWEMRARPTAMVQSNQGQLIVYVDGTRYGNFESLRLIKWRSVAYVRYYSAGAAEAQFGPGNLLGAIEVKTIPH